jgi:hypothetical protein
LPITTHSILIFIGGLTDYCLAWTTYKKFDKKIEELNKKVKELEQKPEFKINILCW